MVAATDEPENETEKDDGTPSVFKAVECLTKGIEVPLPAGHQFSDKDGIVRNRVRVRWWTKTRAPSGRRRCCRPRSARRCRIGLCPCTRDPRCGHARVLRALLAHWNTDNCNPGDSSALITARGMAALSSPIGSTRSPISLLNVISGCNEPPARAVVLIADRLPTHAHEAR